MKDDRKYLRHIVDCIQRIEEDVSGGRGAFDTSHMIQDAVLRNLEVIAESTKRLSDQLKATHPDFDWSGIAGFRNFLIHDYLGVDLGIAWKIVTEDVPRLKAVILRMLE